MKFSISACTLFALTGSNLIAVGVSDDPQAVPIMAPEDEGGDILQAINDTITDVIDTVTDAVMDSPVGDLIGCIQDSQALLDANPDLAAAEMAYYDSVQYSWSNQEVSTPDQYTYDETSTVTVGLDELAAYKAACQAAPDSVWYEEPPSSVMCMAGGSMYTVNYDNGYGVCYPITDACSDFGTTYINALSEFFDFLKQSQLDCSAELGTIPAGTTMAPVAAAVDVTPAPVAAAVEVTPAPVAAAVDVTPAPVATPAAEEPAPEPEAAPAGALSLSLRAAVAATLAVVVAASV